MKTEPAKRVVFISSYPPRKCGIATFTSDLIANIELASEGEFEPMVVAMGSGVELEYDEPGDSLEGTGLCSELCND